MSEGQAKEIGGKPRNGFELIGDAFSVYRRYPLLLFVLAAAVIVPYELIVLWATGGNYESRGAGADIRLTTLEMVFVLPLVSALHVHALAAIRAGETPRLGTVARQGIAALPVVAAAAALATIGIAGGLILLIIPGIFLTVRWLVVAQAAAIERGGPIVALGRSWALTDRKFFHSLGLFLLSFLVAIPIVAATAIPFEGDDVTVVSFLVEALGSVLALSFGALATALLYFDLRLRLGIAGPPPAALPPGQASWDPRVYDDETRPSGWYIVPVYPDRLRYWRAEEEPGWVGETRAPRRIRDAWRAELPDS